MQEYKREGFQQLTSAQAAASGDARVGGCLINGVECCTCVALSGVQRETGGRMSSIPAPIDSKQRSTSSNEILVASRRTSERSLLRLRFQLRLQIQLQYWLWLRDRERFGFELGFIRSAVPTPSGMRLGSWLHQDSEQGHGPIRGRGRVTAPSGAGAGL